MPLDSIADLERRIRRLEMELDQYKHKFVAPDRTVKTEPPLAHIDHGALAGLGDDDHPQYRKVADSIDHGTLTGLGDNDHPQYLLTTGKAADSDKLDGIDSTGYVNTSGDQTVGGVKTFTSIPVLPSSNPTTANQAVRKGYADATYLGISAKAADSDKLDGLDSTAFVQASNLGVWSAWTPTQTGWTALPTGVYRYCKIGKLVMGIIYMSAGTSNSTAAELSLPFTAASNYSSMRGTTGWAMDNSVIQTQPGTWVVGNGATVIKLYKTFPEGAWTASGTKRIITVFFYEAA